MRKLKILIVDDSVLFRSQISLALQGFPEFEVVGVAPNGRVAIESLPLHRPDILIVDVEMPVMDGFATLSELRRLGNGIPVLLFSSLSKSSVEKSLMSLRFGAVDFVAKPSADISGSPAEKIREVLCEKLFFFRDHMVLTETQAKTRGLGNLPIVPKKLPPLFRPGILVIASSTGGPSALEDFFTGLRGRPVTVPIVITQHMPPVFTQALAERLGKICGKKAGEAKAGDLLRPDEIYVAPGNYHLALSGTAEECRIVLNQEAHRNSVRPAADFLFESAASIYRHRTLGMVFTGMGKDGLVGSLSIKRAAGGVFIQNRESCVVFGMPGAVHELGEYDGEGTPQQLAERFIAMSGVEGVARVA